MNNGFVGLKLHICLHIFMGNSMSPHIKEELVFRAGNINDRDALRQAGIKAYSVFENVLDPIHWATMLRNHGDEARFSALFAAGKPFVCEHNGNIAGLVYLVPQGHPTEFFQADWAYIRMLGVLPEYRGLGIAHKLMELCIQEARTTGETMLALHTAGYQQAWRIYERLGFIRKGDLGPLFGNTYWLYQLAL